MNKWLITTRMRFALCNIEQWLTWDLDGSVPRSFKGKLIRLDLNLLVIVSNLDVDSVEIPLMFVEDWKSFYKVLDRKEKLLMLDRCRKARNVVLKQRSLES